MQSSCSFCKLLKSRDKVIVTDTSEAISIASWPIAVSATAVKSNGGSPGAALILMHTCIFCHTASYKTKRDHSTAKKEIGKLTL
jgi:hypothetical protein